MNDSRSRFTVACVIAISTVFAGACRQLDPLVGLSPEGKLARVGLQVISEELAAVPKAKRGRAVPCRVIDERSTGPGRAAALAPWPGGYLIVGVDGVEAESSEEILAALADWQRGEIVSLRVRRNPYLSPETGWWEVQLQLVLQ